MESYNLSRLSILIVDDFQPMRDLLFLMLKHMGVTDLRLAENCKEAEKTLDTFDPDLAIIDYKMPVMNGVEFIHRLRNGECGSNPYLAIIMMTGHSSASIITEARDAGVTEFLAKPISAKLLYGRICKIIEKSRPFVRGGGYFGPDRRRQASSFRGPEKRMVPYDYSDLKDAS